MKLVLPTALLASAALAGCYVVPMAPSASVPGPTAVMPMAPPAPITIAARLYPANDMASQYGMVSAVVNNDLNGRGYFSTNIGGESFAGEATRVAGSQKDGLANGTGNHGGYISCRYTMNTPSLGTGNCRLNNGAAFTMHVGGG